MNSTRPPICAIVVAFNPDDSFQQRVLAIEAQCERLIIVDNSPVPKRVSVSGKTTVLPQQRNVGLARALNIGLAQAQAEKFDWAITFDQDSTPEPGMVEALWRSVTAAEKPERVAVVGPRLTEEKVVHEDHRWIVPMRGFRLGFRRVPCVGNDLPSVAFVITSGALVRLDVVRAVGGMKEELFIDYIDHDFCLRAQELGYTVVVSAGARLQHNLGNKREIAVAGLKVRPTFHSPTRLRYMSRNRWYMYRRFAVRFPHWAAFDFVFSHYNLLRILAFEDQKTAKMWAVLRGTIDGIAGRMGEIQPGS